LVPNKLAICVQFGVAETIIEAVHDI
jgi:hypothetical protein